MAPFERDPRLPRLSIFDSFPSSFDRCAGAGRCENGFPCAVPALHAPCTTPRPSPGVPDVLSRPPPPPPRPPPVRRPAARPAPTCWSWAPVSPDSTSPRGSPGRGTTSSSWTGAPPWFGAIRTTGIFVRKTLDDFPLPERHLGPPIRRMLLYPPSLSRPVALVSDRDEFRVGDMAGLYETSAAVAVEAGVRLALGTRYAGTARRDVPPDRPRGAVPGPCPVRRRRRRRPVERRPRPRPRP